MGELDLFFCSLSMSLCLHVGIAFLEIDERFCYLFLYAYVRLINKLRAKVAQVIDFMDYPI